jgi:hypothetical protein
MTNPDFPVFDDVILSAAELAELAGVPIEDIADPWDDEDDE